MAQRMTVPAVRARKASDGAEPLVMLTAYDAPGARMVDRAGADMILTYWALDVARWYRAEPS